MIGIRWFHIATTAAICLCVNLQALATSDISGGPLAPNQIVITREAQSSSATGTVHIALTLPGAATLDGLRIRANGVDVRSGFSPILCPTVCLSGILSERDGLHAGTNVIYAYVGLSNGAVASGRYTFEAEPAASLSSASEHQASAIPTTNGLLDIHPMDKAVGSTFLPPTLLFQVLTPGGWRGPGQPWFQVGKQTYPTASAAACAGIYEVVVLNRQTLVEETSAPQSSPVCVANAGNLASYLASLSSNDLAIVGTLNQKNADIPLNTSAIGGLDYKSDLTPPLGYLAIGSGHSALGTAFENYASKPDGTPLYKTSMVPFANGLLEEDVNGNYNFQSSDVREFWVDPMDIDPVSGLAGSISMENSSADHAQTGKLVDRYLQPGWSTKSAGGYWLMVLNRDTLTPVDLAPVGDPDYNVNCKVSNNAAGVSRWENCGKTYATGNSADPLIRTAAYQQLAADLNAIGPYRLAILTTWGLPACCGNMFDFAYQKGYEPFGQALETLGGSHRAPLFANDPTHQVLSFITSRGVGDPLTGISVMSTTAYSSSGESGYLHGTFARNQNGLYQPSQSSQQVNAADDAESGPDYTLSKVSLSQPVDWPELGSVLMPGADSIDGQTAAYRYASYALLTQHYIRGSAGPHLDDIHYYFTGSNSNYLNYHYFDPRDLVFPGSSTDSQYCWTSPSTGLAYPCFTRQDFSAVTAQVSTELVDLFNVLNYMVTGPVNLKDTIASGNASAGAALTGAAATVLASSLKPSPSTPVKVNTSNILGLLSGVVSIASAVASDGTITIGSKETTSIINKVVSVIGASLGSAGSITGGLTTDPSPANNGSRYQVFATTIGALADSQLQGQLSVGLDLETDSILSDWGRLNAIGPLVTDTTNRTFYAPNQIAQNAAVKTLGMAAQRSFFISLMPSLYSLHYWPGVRGIDAYDYPANKLTNQPDFSASVKNCTDSFYLDANGLAPSYSFVWSPTASGYNYPSTAINGQHPVDMYVIAAQGVNPNHGTTNVHIPTISQDLGNKLFSAGGLGLPIDEFVGGQGPFASVYYQMQNKNDILASVTGWNPSDICSARPGAIYDGPKGGFPPSIVSTPSDIEVTTATTLQVPAALVLGGTLNLQAHVTASQPISVGSILFTADGAVIADVPLSATGSASYTLTPTLGTHVYQASYARVAPFDTSSSATTSVSVYADAPNLNLTLSQGSLQATYGVTSAPVAIRVDSLNGMEGVLHFSCSGLPVNMGCVFDSPSAPLAAASSVTTNVRITSGSVVHASFAANRFFAFVSAVMMLSLWRARRRFRTACGVVMAIVIFPLALLTGCSSSTPSGNQIQESGTKTILVNATCGTLTRSIPLVVTIQ